MPDPKLKYEISPPILRAGGAEDLVIAVSNTTSADVPVEKVEFVLEGARNGTLVASAAPGWTVTSAAGTFGATPPVTDKTVKKRGLLEFRLHNLTVDKEAGSTKITVRETLTADAASAVGTKEFVLPNVGAPKLTYQILPPSTIVEASFSPEPDDDSDVDITIEVSNPGTSVKVQKIQFVVPVAAPDAAADVRERALTSKPARIQPTVRQANGWSITMVPDGVGPGTVSFDAKPLTGTEIEVTNGTRLGFRLLDLVVIDQDGLSKIQIIETLSAPSGVTVGKSEMSVRKVPAALRIDSFGASKSAVTSVQAAEGITLNWATTGASLILLEGLSVADQKTFDERFKKSSNPDLRDAELVVRPTTTTTYTLRAQSNRSTAQAVRQLTVAVTDQIATPHLAAGTIAANSATIGTPASPGTFTLHGTLTATISALSKLEGIRAYELNGSAGAIKDFPAIAVVSQSLQVKGGTLLFAISGIAEPLGGQVGVTRAGGTGTIFASLCRLKDFDPKSGELQDLVDSFVDHAGFRYFIPNSVPPPKSTSNPSGSDEFKFQLPTMFFATDKVKEGPVLLVLSVHTMNPLGPGTSTSDFNIRPIFDTVRVLALELPPGSLRND